MRGAEQVSKTRVNHYVPQWYQSSFFSEGKNTLCYLDLQPDKKVLPDGRVIQMNDLHHFPTSLCFSNTDLYSTFFGKFINDEIERRLFGQIDNSGARAVRAFCSDDISLWQRHFQEFFEYLDAQKIRTPKGLCWIRNQYPSLSQNDLMMEMQGIRNMNCTLWTESTREVLSAEDAQTKFIVSDHPVTIFNYACPPDHELCGYPNDPSIALKGSQTLFPMSKDFCLVLTNLEYAESPSDVDPIEKRTFSINFRHSIVRTDAFIRERKLSDGEVAKINFILKSRARRFIGAGKKEWLFPEKDVHCSWEDLHGLLLPPSDKLWHFGGEIFARFQDGSVYYQDKFGRTEKPFEHLQKKQSSKNPNPNDCCGCGSGKKYKKCCKQRQVELRPSWTELSIRERNILLFEGITNVLELRGGHDWAEVRRNITTDKISMIYKIYASLWPLETDLSSLLPKPDGNARALYTGIVDPRMITEFLASSTLYFGETIVQNPMIHHRVVKSEFSPVEQPEQYRQELIKGVVLLFKLMPFIENATINFIPDPCIFDHHLRDQMFSCSQERAAGLTINLEDDPRSKWPQMDDIRRSIRSLSDSSIRNRILEEVPSIKEDEIKETIQHWKKRNEDDPLSSLNHVGDALGEISGQLLMMNMSPNFEISLYLAQLMGAYVVTDSLFRWRELLGAQKRDLGIVTQRAPKLIKLIGKSVHKFIPDVQAVATLHSKGPFVEYRRFVQTLYDATTSHTSEKVFENLSDRFTEVFEASQKCIDRGGSASFGGNISCVIPKKGISHNNSHRMLLTSGQEHYRNSVPVAFYFSREDIEVYKSPI